MSTEKSTANLNYTHDSPEMTPTIYELATTNRHNLDTQNTLNKQALNININNAPVTDTQTHTNTSPHHSNTFEHHHDTFSIDEDEQQFKLFANQVAGTLPMLHSDGKLYKPLKTDLEQKFYTHILDWLPSIQAFIPKYCGIQQIKINTSSESESDYSPSITDNDNCPSVNPWSTQMFKKHKKRMHKKKMPFLILEDLTLKYKKPNILDLKIGTRHFPPICRMAKMERKLRKSWCSTCKDFGLRIGGLQMYHNQHKQYEIMAKHKAMLLSKAAFVQNLMHFFAGTHYEKKTLAQFIVKLNKIYHILKTEHRFRWFSCSLLFVYEGMHSDDNDNDIVDMDGNLNSNSNSSEELEFEHKMEHKLCKLDLKLIDFTNFVVVGNYLKPMKNEYEHKKNVNNNNVDVKVLQLNDRLDNLNEPDHGILFGLETIIKLMNELKETGSIKERDEKEWIAFRDGMCHSKMALLPFSLSGQEFNEDTTINIH